VTNLFTEQGHQPCVQPATWRTGTLYLCPQWRGGPVAPPGTGFPCRCLLRLAGLRRRNSNLPPRGGGKVITVFNCLRRYEDIWRNGCITPRIFNIGTRWRWSGQLNAQATLPLGEEPRYPLGGPHSWWESYGEQKMLLPLLGIEPLFFGCPARSLVTIPSTQFRLL
jgi:hypothetical protein